MCISKKGPGYDLNKNVADAVKKFESSAAFFEAAKKHTKGKFDPVAAAKAYDAVSPGYVIPGYAAQFADWIMTKDAYDVAKRYPAFRTSPLGLEVELALGLKGT